ncbi:hypothetical protein L596_011561 [Steinernema carpocapsae]|uniref:Uncharacterized protein n=1 Tax=Steinernema carpocapsae TaxID=34508 RepID=A0A4U5NUR4_STECR|nr:hypothetical protein L596_011561 [Steinernema carpocapsae]
MKSAQVGYSKDFLIAVNRLRDSLEPIEDSPSDFLVAYFDFFHKTVLEISDIHESLLRTSAFQRLLKGQSVFRSYQTRRPLNEMDFSGSQHFKPLKFFRRS